MRPSRFFLVACILLCQACVHPPAPRGWDQYQVIMWSTGAPKDIPRWIARLRELGFTAEECTGCDARPYVDQQFGFYVENLVPELAFLHNRQAIYQADFNGYTTPPHDKSYLLRKPCFHDPAFWDTAQTRVQALVRPYPGRGPLAYDLRDELSLGSFASPMDYCFAPDTLRAFRAWLQSAYGSLDALNQEWETSFASWDEVVPMTTYEVKDRERAALAAGTPENYAPWADHRAFMDLTFAQTLDRFRGFIRELDGVTPVGIEGVQMPSAWDGFDLWRLSRVVDWVEPYDIAGSREIFRSFLPPGTPILSTAFGSDFDHLRQKLWWLLLNGDRGFIVWDDDNSRSILKDQPDMPVTGRGRGLAQVIAELKSAAPRILPLERLDDRIAIHYSQASIRAHWMFDSREDKDTWPRRFSSYEAAFSRIARVRDSFLRVIEDLGLQYQFVSYEQIENGELLHGGYKVLLLPQSVAMSESECRRVEEFVRAGGTVIADNMAATMDEHCRRLPQGRLDALFGIEHHSLGWRARPAGGSVPGAPLLEGFDPDLKVNSGSADRTGAGVPVVVQNIAGSGRAVYLNLDMHNYGRYRLAPPQGQEIRDLFARLLRAAGVEASVKVLDAESGQPAPCVEVFRFAGAGGLYLAVMRNPEFGAASTLKQAGYPDNSALETTVRVRIVLPSPAEPVEADLTPWAPLILSLQGSQARLL